jgi:probable F420-dependent oxidoreductase
VAKLAIGRVGAVVSPELGDAFVGTAVGLEGLGFPTLWVPGGPLGDLAQVAEVVRATKGARVATGIIPVVRFPAENVAALYADLEATHPGRFLLGLGGAHGPRPVPTLETYLDRMDEASIPASRRLLAALGPRMLDLARRRASGALPILMTPEATTEARATLGDDTTLAVEEVVVVESDPAAAREVARRPLRFLSKNPAYQAHFRRMGFTDEEIGALADRLVDALVAWGDADAVAARVEQTLAAGADHVAVSLATADPGPALDTWARLADRLVA